MKQNLLWSDEANKCGADVERVQVWDALSELFLDSYRTEDELDALAERIASTPFSFNELGHILFCEIGPVCFPNLLMIVGGEGMGFAPEWLISKCLERQRAKPYQPTARPEAIPFWMHLSSPLYFDAYLLIYRTQRLRKARK